MDTGGNPTAKQLREAERVLALTPAQQSNHPSAVKADHEQLSHINTYGDLPDYYLDTPFTCRVCGRRQIWKAQAQKHYYEVAKGHIDAIAVECGPCRRARRQGGGGKKSAG